MTLREKRVGSRVKPLTVFSYFGMAVMVGAFILAYVWVRLQVIQTGYEINKLREQRERISNINQHREVQLMALASLKSVEEKGRQMQLVMPTKDRIVFVVQQEAPSVWQSIKGMFSGVKPSDRQGG